MDMAEKRYMNGAAENIGKKLTEIRRQGYREDPSDTPPLLYRLGYDGFRSPEQVEALLIKAIHHAIHNQDDRELLLMAFRLLRGYDDATMKDIGDRRRRYVLEHKRLTKDEMIAYQAAGDDPDAKMAALKAAYDRLRKEEDRLIVKLSNMLSVISDIDSYVEDIDDYLNLVPATTDSLQRLSSFTSTKAANTLPSHLYEVIQTARLGMLSPYLYSFIDAFYRKAQGDTEVPELEGLKPEDYVSFFSSVSPIAHLLDAKRARHFEYSRHQMIENEAQEKITTGDVQEITKVYRELWRKYKVPVKDRDLTIVERPSDGLFSMEVAVCLEDLSALEEICLEYEDEYEDEDDNT